jgi:hypothetical protein
MTTHLAIPVGCTTPAAYRDPIKNIQPDRMTPPVIAEVRLPHLSARRKPGMLIASMRMPETPEARKEALSDDSPACLKRMGAY